MSLCVELPCCVQLSHSKSLQGDQYPNDMCAHVTQDKGYEIVASFGDQWSDLAGTSAAVASFKLPNPFYYIL